MELADFWRGVVIGSAVGAGMVTVIVSRFPRLLRLTHIDRNEGN